MIFDPSSLKFWMAVIVLGLLAWEIYSLWLAKLSMNWPTAKCTILEAYIDEQDNDGIVYFPKVRYSYKIGSRTYQSTRFSYQSLSLATLGEASDLLRGISKGKEIPVFYDPNVPSRSVLLRGYSSSNFFGIVIICIILILIFTHN
jgi:hypothetical protein